MVSKSQRVQGVTKRKGSPYWWISYQVRGQQVRESSKTTSHRLAVELLTKRKNEAMIAEQFPERVRGKMTLGELRDSWMERVRIERPRCLPVYRRGVARALQVIGANRSVLSLTRKDILDARAYWADAKKPDGEPYSGSHINQMLAAMSGLMSHAMDLDIIQYNVVRGVKRVPTNERSRMWTPGELQLVASTADHELAAFLTVAYWTGIRKMALASVEQSQVDLEHDVLSLRADQTKTKKARRVPLHPEASLALGFWLAARGKAHRVFKSSGKSLTWRWETIRRRLGLVDLRIHDTRHTAATNLRRAGVDPLSAGAMTGHSSVVMLKKYNVFEDKDLEQVRKKISDL